MHKDEYVHLFLSMFEEGEANMVGAKVAGAVNVGFPVATRDLVLVVHLGHLSFIIARLS